MNTAKEDLRIAKDCQVSEKLPVGARCGLLHRRVEKGITEEVQRATENNSGIISGLKASNQKSVLANSMGVLVRFKKKKKVLVRKRANGIARHT